LSVLDHVGDGTQDTRNGEGMTVAQRGGLADHNRFPGYVFVATSAWP